MVAGVRIGGPGGVGAPRGLAPRNQPRCIADCRALCVTTAWLNRAGSSVPRTEFRLAYGESPYAYLMTRRIERAMALLRRGDLSVTEVCFEVGCSSLGTFSTRFTELVGMPPSTYRRHAARATAGMPSCVAKQVTRPIRNREARVTEPQLA
jgi:AraC-like DNA-binding protein